MIRAPRYLRCLVRSAWAVTLVAAITVVPAAALASETTWSVQPANEKGPDGRRWIELAVDPGDVVTEHLAVSNFGRAAATFAVKAADGYLTKNGRFNMLASDEVSVDGGTWIDVRDKVSVGPRKMVVIPFTITVPHDATPGDHPAGIAASIMSTNGTVAVESRVGFRVMIRARGSLDPQLAIANASTTYTHTWNPFATGSLRVSYDVTNTGNIGLAGQGRVEAANLFGSGNRDVTPPKVEQVLAGGSRTVATTIAGVWPLGRITTDITVTPAPAGDEKIDAALEPVTVTLTTWVMPWPQLLLIATGFLAVGGARYLRRRRRQRLDELLARARDEGRRESVVSGGTPSISAQVVNGVQGGRRQPG